MGAKDILFLGHSLVEFHDWQASFPAHRAVNLGVAGETVEGLRARLGGIIREHPRADLLFIVTGTNNVAMDDLDFMDTYRDIIGRLSSAYPEAGLYVHSIPPVMFGLIPLDYIREANRSIRKLAVETGAGYIDLYSLFTDGDGLVREDCFVEDGVHLSAKGYALWTGLIGEIVEG